MPGRSSGKPGDETVQQLADDLLRKRVERKSRDAATREPEAPPVGALRSRQHEQEDGVVSRPLEQVIEKIDHARIGPLQVLDHHHNRQVLGQALEEQAPAREELFSREHLGCGEPEKLAEARRDEFTVGGVCDPALEACAKSFGDDLGWVLLAYLEPCADHLGQSPVAHPLPIGEATPGVPENVARQAVDVLEELPGEP